MSNKHADQLRKAREGIRNNGSVDISNVLETELPQTDIYSDSEAKIPVAKEKSDGLGDSLENSDKYDTKSEPVGAIYQDGEWASSYQYSRLEDDSDDSSFIDALEYE